MKKKTLTLAGLTLATVFGAGHLTHAVVAEPKKWVIREEAPTPDEGKTDEGSTEGHKKKDGACGQGSCG